MTPGPPFAEMLRLKRRLGWGLVAVGMLALAGTIMLGGEIFNTADLIPGLLAVGAIGWGLMMVFSHDPAQL